MAPPSNPRLITISVIGVSGNERLKGSQGVGKSLLCNRFIRGDHDDFHFEHSSILSQTDFSGSAVINNEHWLFWGEREIHHEDESLNIRLIEHTVFLDDVEFEPLAGPFTPESYSKRAVALKLESRDKLMYIQKEQLGQEAEFPQRILPDGKTSVDGFVFVFDVSSIPGRDLGKHIHAAQQILVHAVKTKRPIVIAASKFDSASEEGKALLQEILHSSHLRSHHFPIIEISALKRVNVEEVFLSLAQLVLKWKHRLKIQSFAEAFRTVNLQALEARESYVSVLKGCVPVEEWPSRRPSWDRLLSEFSINRNLIYQRFVAIYGLLAARKLYERHVEEAREHWTKARLRALFPQLPRVFGNLLSRKELMSLTWSEANERIHQHPLFDEFFQPLGALSKQLEPISSPSESGYGTVGGSTRGMMADSRIPAEILLRAEARTTYEEYKQHVEQEQRRERLEEDFENLLANNAQICAGRSLPETSIFLQGSTAFEALSPAHAELIYNRYQSDLIKRAEAEFSECLLENIELFAELIRRSRFDRQAVRGPSFMPTENELALVRTVLQDDSRYRQLSRLWELRDGMIANFCSFIAHPQPSLCVGRSRCLEVAPFDGLLSSFLGFEANSLPIVSLSVHGKPHHVAQFITDLACFLHGEPFQSAVGLARIHCFSGDDDTPQDFSVTVYLLDGSTPTESISSNEHFSPILVAVGDPSEGTDLLQLHQQGATLAELMGTIFAGVDVMDSDSGRTPDCTNMFGRRQLMRVLESACALSLEGGRAGVRVRLSSCCGDLPLEPLLSVFHSPPLVSVLPHPNPLRAGVIPQLVLLDEGSMRVDVRVGSIHSWIAARHAYSTHGHALVYSTRRRASWASARAAVCRLLNDEGKPQQIRPILLIAVQESPSENAEMEIQLENEGREVADGVGALFVSTKLNEGSMENLLRAWMCFVGRILSLRLDNPNRSLDSRNDRADAVDSLGMKLPDWIYYDTSVLTRAYLWGNVGDGYATLNEPRRESGGSESTSPSTRRGSTTMSGGNEEFHEERQQQERRRTQGVEVRPQQQQQPSSTRPTSSSGSMVCSSSSGSAESAPLFSSSTSTPHSNHRHPPPPPRRDLTTTRAPIQVYEGISGPIHHSPQPSQPTSTQRRSFGFGFGRGGEAPMRRRAPPAPRLLFPGPPIHPIESAPLATPELIDIAPEYSTVQDADEHIYATLEDVVVDKQKKDKKSYKSQKRSSSRGSQNIAPIASPPTSLNSEPSMRSHRSNPQTPGLPSSTGGVFMRSPVVRVRSTAPCLSPLPSSSGVSSTATSPSSTSSFRPRSGIFSSSSRTGKSKEPEKLENKNENKNAKVLEKRSSLFFGSRSVTMDVIAGSSMRQVLARKGKQLVQGMKESISAESLVREGKKKKKRKGIEGDSTSITVPPHPSSTTGGLVRKVASSFRLGRKGHTTSLAPSPAASPQPERRQVLKASCEKVVTAFTWLPSRSPKRNGRAASAEITTLTSNRLLVDECARGGGLPLFLARCVQFIEAEGGLETEGLYRIPGNQSQLAEVERQFASNSAPDLSSIELPLHVVATALKNFFSQLTEPVLPLAFHDPVADSVIMEDSEKTIFGLSHALSSLPTPNRITLSFLLGHLRKVAAAPATAMDVTNLSKVWWPTLFRPEFSSFAAMTNGTKRLQNAAEALLVHSAVLFPEKNNINNNATNI